MSDEAKRILEGAIRLPDTERAALASSSPEEIEAAWIAEVDRRREDLRAGRTTAVSWQEVRREIFDMVERAREPRATS